MVEKAGNSSPLVKFTYVENGKTVTKRIYVQPGLIFDFGGKEANEKGRYTVGDDGKVYNEKGYVVSEINLSQDQVGALMGISHFDQSDNPYPRFEISDGDIYEAMNYENGYGRDARINYQLSNIGADGEVVPIPQSFKPGEDGYDPDYQPEPITYTDANGVLRTEITGSDGSKSTIKIESPRVRAYQEKVR